MAPTKPTMAMKSRKIPQAIIPPTTGRLSISFEVLAAAATPIKSSPTN